MNTKTKMCHMYIEQKTDTYCMDKPKNHYVEVRCKTTMMSDSTYMKCLEMTHLRQKTDQWELTKMF
jgi:hypothetical protein